MILLQKKPFSVIVHLGVSVRKQRQFEIIVYTPEAGHYPISGLVINCHYYNSLIKKSIHFSVFLSTVDYSSFFYFDMCSQKFTLVKV